MGSGKWKEIERIKKNTPEEKETIESETKSEKQEENERIPSLNTGACKFDEQEVLIFDRLILNEFRRKSWRVEEWKHHVIYIEIHENAKISPPC